MGFAGLFLLAVGLSMDAFAAAVCLGLAMHRADLKKMFTVGLYFGAFQAAMPAVGYAAAISFAEGIRAYDHWVAFALLLFIGGKMIWGAVSGGGKDDGESGEPRLDPSRMLPLALATSIDAMAVGVWFAVQDIDLARAVSLIGVTTLVLSMAGVKIGSVFGARFKSAAELAGGVILVLIGARILIEHIFIDNTGVAERIGLLVAFVS